MHTESVFIHVSGTQVFADCLDHCPDVLAIPGPLSPRPTDPPGTQPGRDWLLTGTTQAIFKLGSLYGMGMHCLLLAERFDRQ